jgi:hypothetical protein
VALRPTLSDGLPFSSFQITKNKMFTDGYSNTNANAIFLKNNHNCPE